MKSRLVLMLFSLFSLLGCSSNGGKQYVFDYQMTSTTTGVAAWRHYMDPENPILLITDELIYDSANEVFLWHTKNYNEKMNATFLDDTYEISYSYANELVKFRSSEKYQNDKYDVDIKNGWLVWSCEGYKTVTTKPSFYDGNKLKEFIGVE